MHAATPVALESSVSGIAASGHRGVLEHRSAFATVRRQRITKFGPARTEGRTFAGQTVVPPSEWPIPSSLSAFLRAIFSSMSGATPPDSRRRAARAHPARPHHAGRRRHRNHGGDTGACRAARDLHFRPTAATKPWRLFQNGPIPSSLSAFLCAIFALVVRGSSTARNQSAPALALAIG